MEKRITFETATVFRLPVSELRKFYLSWGLLQYNYLRSPDYDEEKLLKLLSSDLKKHSVEIYNCLKQSPDSLKLNRLYNFLELHHRTLLEVLIQRKE